MSLVVPKWGFQYCFDTLGGFIPGNDNGTLWTLGASNSKGSTTALASGNTLTDDCYYVAVQFSVAFSAGTIRNCLIDIMYDPAGGTSWSVLLPDLAVGQSFWASGFTGQTPAPNRYEFPVFIPAGSSLGVRGQNSTASTIQGYMNLWAWGSPSRPDAFWYGTKIDALGLDSANSRGTVLTPGASGAYGTAISLTATKPYGWLQIGSPATNTLNDTRGYQFRLQTSSSATVPWPGMGNIVRANDVDERATCEGMWGPRWIDMVGNETIYVSAACHTTGPIDQYVVVYGVY